MSRLDPAYREALERLGSPRPPRPEPDAIGAAVADALLGIGINAIAPGAGPLVSFVLDAMRLGAR